MAERRYRFFFSLVCLEVEQPQAPAEENETRHGDPHRRLTIYVEHPIGVLDSFRNSNLMQSSFHSFLIVFYSIAPSSPAGFKKTNKSLSSRTHPITSRGQRRRQPSVCEHRKSLDRSLPQYPYSACVENSSCGQSRTVQDSTKTLPTETSTYVSPCFTPLVVAWRLFR